MFKKDIKKVVKKQEVYEVFKKAGLFKIEYPGNWMNIDYLPQMIELKAIIQHFEVLLEALPDEMSIDEKIEVIREYDFHQVEVCICGGYMGTNKTLTVTYPGWVHYYDLFRYYEEDPERYKKKVTKIKEGTYKKLDEIYKTK